MAGRKGWRWSFGRCKGLVMLLVALAVATGTSARADGAAADGKRIEQLERKMTALSQELRLLRKDREADQKRQKEYLQALKEISQDVSEVKDRAWLDPESWLNKFHLGGYGEMHGNFGEGKQADQFDIHRLVLYLGYDFADWIRFHSEIEVEHAFVSSSAGGEVSIEQLYVDFLLSEPFNVRVGRILTPLGIVNKKHEPPTFLGVERPSFAKFIIPTTWSSDGVGIFGTLASWLKYELYVVGGLDGSGFNSKDGIRKGRIKERPSLHEPAFTGRLDFYPLADREVAYDQDLRVGLSTYFGGLDNGNKGNNPDINGNIHIYSADAEYSIWKFDFRGAIAYEVIDGAREIGNGTAKSIFGYYGEVGYHFWPDSWKKGKLKDSDAVVFGRFDRYDTQHSMPSGIAKNPAGDRSDLTFGVNFYLTPNFVLKADYQIRQDDSSDDLENLLNVGVGWIF